MANQWLRLWHDMPNDPKWRTIANKSGQQISLVLAIYIHLLVDASRNVTRGHIDVTPEDLASALDVTEDQINSVLVAMEGRVIEDKKLSGWDARQPLREDQGNPETGAKSAAERKREQRAREKECLEQSQCHDASRNVTLDKDKEEIINSKIKKTKTQCPEFLTPSETQAEFARINKLVLDDEVFKFLNHHGAKGSTYQDWEKAFWTWLHNAIKFSGNKKRGDDLDDIFAGAR